MHTIFTKKSLFAIFIFILPFCGYGFGVLTHEAIIDAQWDKFILPLLKSKYPSSTEQQLKDAHAYAYGGAVSPDMGYYPFGSPLFTNLVHYVRSGDMVDALLRDAVNLNQYAFALGFLSHYEADNYGHPLATNRSVPIVYPKLEKKYGDVITYADNKISHMRMEFGFDVLEIARGNYASEAYHNFIGFKVDTAVLAKAFFETYGLKIDNVFKHRFSFAVEIFRWTVANIFPVITKTAWASKKSEILKQDSTITSEKFRYKMHRKEYDKQYGTGYKRPGFFPTVLSFFIRVLPKVGPLRALKFKPPTKLSEKYFDQSFDSITHYYTANLKKLNQQNVILKDMDFDTGKPTIKCEYILADKTYNTWLLRLKNNKFKDVTKAEKQNIIRFYQPQYALKNVVTNKKCKKIFVAFQALENYDL